MLFKTFYQMELIMNYIKTAIATNTDIDNSDVVIDLTGEECPKFVATRKKNQMQLHDGCRHRSHNSLPPLLVEDPPRVVISSTKKLQSSKA